MVCSCDETGRPTQRSYTLDGLPTGTIRGRGRPKLRWIDNFTKWSGRSVGELRGAAIERDQVMAGTPGVHPNYNLSRGHRRRSMVNDDDK